MNNINVIIKRPGEDPCMASVPNTLEALQKLVGGYIETVTLCSDLAVICNEEGRLIGLPRNCKVCGVDFVGTIVFAGVDGDEFADVPCDLKGIRALFPRLWEEKDEKERVRRKNEEILERRAARDAARKAAQE